MLQIKAKKKLTTNKKAIVSIIRCMGFFSWLYSNKLYIRSIFRFMSFFFFIVKVVLLSLDGCTNESNTHTSNVTTYKREIFFFLNHVTSVCWFDEIPAKHWKQNQHKIVWKSSFEIPFLNRKKNDEIETIFHHQFFITNNKCRNRRYYRCFNINIIDY